MRKGSRSEREEIVVNEATEATSHPSDVSTATNTSKKIRQKVMIKLEANLNNQPYLTLTIAILT